jgi:hypothetical protein
MASFPNALISGITRSSVRTYSGPVATWDQRLMRIKQIAETAAAKQPKK